MAESIHESASSDKIIIIGAGMAGVSMGVQLQRLLQHQNFHIYEKFSDVGGTWAQNTYPNLSCDVPSEFYSFSFFPNPNWSEKYASQPEILQYIHDCVDHFDLGHHVSLEHECQSMTWSDEHRLWTLSMHDIAHNRIHTVQARYVITAMGVLSVPNGLDNLPALTQFGGQCFHASRWRDVDLQGKRVMVIGNGCSANQVIPWILNKQNPESVVQLARSAQWVVPKDNYPLSTFERACLKYIPLAMYMRRLMTAIKLDTSFFMFRHGPWTENLRRSTAKNVQSYMMSTANPMYHDSLIPEYEFGAKRPVMDHGYLEATNNPKFRLVRCDGIVAVKGSERRTIVDAAGNDHEVDIVILANGFQTQDLLVPMEVRGQQGRNLREEWQNKGGAEAYMGVSAHGFPNFFMLAGPNTLPSGNSTLHGIECSVVYVTRILRGIWYKSSASNDGRTRKDANIAVMPTREAETQFNVNIQEGLKAFVYTKHVRTWYVNHVSGKNTLIWPGTQVWLWWSRCVSWVQWSDWEMKL